ncbi:HD domain-containing phosphohydrolase [Planctomycetota bacterium]
MDNVEKLRQDVEFYSSNLDKLTKIGMALSSVSDLDELLKVILFECRQLLSADSGSIYLRLDAAGFPDAVKTDPEDPMVESGKVLLFQEAQNDSIDFSFQATTMPVSKRSIAGYVAMTKEILNIPDLYNIPEGVEYQFNTSYDKESGYRSKSMLTLPMLAHNGEVLGVISLLNRKKDFSCLLKTPANFEEQLYAFDEACQDLGKAVASQAAVSIENSKLTEDIKKLFDSFVITSVKAVEARDPSTAGHSSRVASLAVALAKAVDASDLPAFKDIHFTATQLNCLGKGGLLHDFGKIGVREHVLNKSNKLYPHQQIALLDRFRLMEKLAKIRRLEDDIFILEDDQITEGEKKILLEQGREQYTKEVKEIHDDMLFMRDCDIPSFLTDEKKDRINAIANKIFIDDSGTEIPYIMADELNNLLIVKGSLNQNEREEIESHVTQSHKLLEKIPWTQDYAGMMESIYYHHECLDGSGYPKGISENDIPIFAMIMHVVDIFDALVATDRPYKKAMPLEKALNILMLEAKDNHISKDLVDLFMDEKIYNVIKSKLKKTE